MSSIQLFTFNLAITALCSALAITPVLGDDESSQSSEPTQQKDDALDTPKVQKLGKPNAKPLTVAGKVLNASGEPASGVEVHVVSRYAEVDATITTDEAGAFQLELRGDANIAYSLQISAMSSAGFVVLPGKEVASTTADGKFEVERYAESCYLHVTNADQTLGAILELKAEETGTTLRLQKLGSASGRLVTEDGSDPAAGVKLRYGISIGNGKRTMFWSRWTCVGSVPWRLCSSFATAGIAEYHGSRF